MLAFVNFSAGIDRPVVARTAVGSITRMPQLPVELSGVTVAIGGAAAGIKSVSQRQLVIVVPKGLRPTPDGTEYPLVINNNGIVHKGSVVLVPAQPDVFAIENIGPGGRANVRNVTNRVHTFEPFGVRTVQLRGGKLVASRFRIFVTGVSGSTQQVLNIRLGFNPQTTAIILTDALPFEPGIQMIDFTVPPEIAGRADQAVTVSVLDFSGTIFTSRLADTAPQISFY